MITSTLDLPLHEYVQGCDASLLSHCMTAIFKSSQEHKDTLRYHTRSLMECGKWSTQLTPDVQNRNEKLLKAN